MTDVMWTNLINIPSTKKFEKLYNKDKKQFYRIMKGDWYGLDFVYLSKHFDMNTWKIFCYIDNFPNEYLSFYSYDAFTIRFNEIKKFYAPAKYTKNRYFKYLTPKECSSFVNTASKQIFNELQKI